MLDVKKNSRNDIQNYMNSFKSPFGNKRKGLCNDLKQKIGSPRRRYIISILRICTYQFVKA